MAESWEVYQGRAAVRALGVQDAVNLAAVVTVFDRAMTDLWMAASLNKTGTDWVNKHPVSQLFADKIVALTNHGLITGSKSYALVKAMAEVKIEDLPKEGK